MQESARAETGCSPQQPATCNSQPAATCNLQQPASSNLQPATAYSNLQPATANNLQQQLTAAAAYSNNNPQQQLDAEPHSQHRGRSNIVTASEDFAVTREDAVTLWQLQMTLQ
jgi:hypothetical protein